MHQKVSEITLPYQQIDSHRRHLLGSEPMIFHCHYYNAFLQQTILDAAYIDSRPFLLGAAAEVSFNQLSSLFRSHDITGIEERKLWAEYIYAHSGFGRISLESISEGGGIVEAPTSHYVEGWQAINKSNTTKPVCYFTGGWLCGALSAIYDQPNGYYGVEEKQCAAMDASHCSFSIWAGSSNYTVFQSVGTGTLSEKHIIQTVPNNNVDYDGIYQAVSGMDLSGNVDGFIPAFGVLLTHHYANYYNRTSFELLRQMSDRFGEEGREIAEELLTEAGRVCSFHTAGGMMISDEWDALVRPMLKTKEDWLHGITAIVNTFGWGRWQLVDVSSQGAEFVMHDDYESCGYMAMYGTSKHPVSFMMQGGVAGLMTLVYIVDIAQKPELTSDLYRKVFKREKMYKTTVLKSKAMGDDLTHLKVTL